MTSTKISRWLGACALGSLLVLGCRHARKHDECICCDCCEYVQPVPADPVKKPVKTAVDTLPAYDKEQVAVKKVDERPVIQYRVVAPGMSPGSGDLVGTEEITAADAEKVQIRPGHTPGALYIPGKTAPTIVPVLAGEKKAEPAEASENPSVPRMVIPQKPPEESPSEPQLPQ